MDEEMNTTEEPDQDAVRLLICADHAPLGITPEPNDDGRPSCCVCGKANYAVKPYRIKADVAARGWRYAPDQPYAQVNYDAQISLGQPARNDGDAVKLEEVRS
jgi:hypothetical protein